MSNETKPEDEVEADVQPIGGDFFINLKINSGVFGFRASAVTGWHHLMPYSDYERKFVIEFGSKNYSFHDPKYAVSDAFVKCMRFFTPVISIEVGPK